VTAGPGRVSPFREGAADSLEARGDEVGGAAEGDAEVRRRSEEVAGRHGDAGLAQQA
jgi:hypothetical protein